MVPCTLERNPCSVFGRGVSVSVGPGCFIVFFKSSASFLDLNLALLFDFVNEVEWLIEVSHYCGGTGVACPFNLSGFAPYILGSGVKCGRVCSCGTFWVVSIL